MLAAAVVTDGILPAVKVWSPRPRQVTCSRSPLKSGGSRIKGKPAEPRGLCCFCHSPLCLLSHMHGNWVRGSVYLGRDAAAGMAVWISSLLPADALQRTGLKGEEGCEGGRVSGEDPQCRVLGTKGRDEGKLGQM